MTKTSLRNPVALGLLAVMLLFVWSCQATKPLPQPRRVIDPSQVDGSVQSQRWDLGAVHYEHFGQGMDYREAGLDPVFLVFKNKSLQTPVVQVEEVRGVGADGEYLAFTLEEATKLVFASEAFSTTMANASRTGALGAFLGAGLGALAGTIGGGDNIWKGAAIGAGVGALAGGAAGTMSSSEADLKRTIRDELRQYGWNEEPIPPDFTRVGYVYLPAGRGIETLKVIVRVDGQVLPYSMRIAAAQTQAPAK